MKGESLGAALVVEGVAPVPSEEADDLHRGLGIPNKALINLNEYMKSFKAIT